jgi:Contractile injection system tube protein
MTTFPNSPKLLKGGLVLIDPETSAVQRVIALQYNPETLSRTLQVQGSGEGAGRAEALRLTGPPIETIKVEVEIDATDQLELAEATTTQLGIHPILAALETIVYPTSSQLQANNTLAQSGTLEITPMEAPLTLFIWSQQRILPVRITDFSVTEEAFDPNLNPLRAKVSLGMRVLSIDDLGFSHKGGSLFMSYLQNKEQLAAKSAGGALGTLGITGIP